MILWFILDTGFPNGCASLGSQMWNFVGGTLRGWSTLHSSLKGNTTNNAREDFEGKLKLKIVLKNTSDIISTNHRGYCV